MIEKLKTHKKTVKEKGTIGKAITSSITTLSKIVGTIIEKKYEINPNGIIDSIKDSGKAIADVKLTKSDFNKMLPLENAVKQIKSVIQDLSKEKKIILIVDELDRCLPEYAIKVLERLHHVCNGMPVIQVIAYSGKALANSIAQIYGQKSDDEISEKAFAEHYLEKFVNLTLPLDYGTSKNNFDMLYEDLPKNYRPTFYESEKFLENFYKELLGKLPIRNRKQVFSTVKMFHELTLATNNFEDFVSTYELLCCEIIIVIDRIVLHAQKPFYPNLSLYQTHFTIAPNIEDKIRSSTTMRVDELKELIAHFTEEIKTQLINQTSSGYLNKMPTNSCSSLVILSLTNDIASLQIENNYSYLLARPIAYILHNNIKFLKQFRSLLFSISAPPHKNQNMLY